ncbi:MAG: transglutaminase family protein [Elusimicrobia bacterium]|nr:transglutaminase family protein [Elusimicrobiota bacterium]
MNQRRLTERDVELLLTFLVDENPNTARLARRQVAAVARARPKLLPQIETINDPRVRVETRRVMEDVRLEALDKEFLAIAEHPDTFDLETAASLLSRLGHPDADPSDIRRQLDGIAAALEEAVDAADGNSAESADLLRHYLFQELGFRGNADHYQDPDNSYLNRVLERRLGIPISLSVVALFVAWRLDIPMFGVGLPGHFVLGHEVPGGARYLDPFNGGRILSRHDCARIVEDSGGEFRDGLLEPATRQQILTRMMTNLLNIYSERGDEVKARRLRRWLDLFLK